MSFFKHVQLHKYDLTDKGVSQACYDEITTELADAKNALSENNNDLNAASEYLRKKGLAKASKKTSREANEGAVGIYENEKIVAIIKVNSETDFAAKSEKFLNFLDDLGNIILSNNTKLTKNDFLNLKFNDLLVSDLFKNMISQIGENLVLNDIFVFEKK